MHGAAQDAGRSFEPAVQTGNLLTLSATHGARQTGRMSLPNKTATGPTVTAKQLDGIHFNFTATRPRLEATLDSTPLHLHRGD